MNTDVLRGGASIVRPGNVISAGLLTGAGAFVATGGLDSHPLALAAAMGATMGAVGGGNAINDYVDRDIDRITDPDRPIPSGQITPIGALWLSAGLIGLSLLLVTVLPRSAQLIAVLNAVFLVTYTSVFKGLPGLGNVLVGYLTGSAFWFGAASVGEPTSPVVLGFAGLAAVVTVAREIVKDIEDIDGDRANGLRTLPIATSERCALFTAGGCVGLGLLASPVPALLGELGSVYLVGVGFANVVLVWGVIAAASNPGRGQRWLKRGMLIALGAFILSQFT